jgi:hypothetical protein
MGEIEEIKKEVRYDEESGLFYVTNTNVFKHDPISYSQMVGQVKMQIEQMEDQLGELKMMDEKYGAHLEKANQLMKEQYEKGKAEAEAAQKKEEEAKAAEPTPEAPVEAKPEVVIDVETKPKETTE